MEFGGGFGGVSGAVVDTPEADVAGGAGVAELDGIIAPALRGRDPAGDTVSLMRTDARIPSDSWSLTTVLQLVELYEQAPYEVTSGSSLAARLTAAYK